MTSIVCRLNAKKGNAALGFVGFHLLNNYLKGFHLDGPEGNQHFIGHLHHELLHTPQQIFDIICFHSWPEGEEMPREGAALVGKALEILFHEYNGVFTGPAQEEIFSVVRQRFTMGTLISQNAPVNPTVQLAVLEVLCRIAVLEKDSNVDTTSIYTAEKMIELFPSGVSYLITPHYVNRRNAMSECLVDMSFNDYAMQAKRGDPVGMVNMAAFLRKRILDMLNCIVDPDVRFQAYISLGLDPSNHDDDARALRVEQQLLNDRIKWMKENLVVEEPDSPFEMEGNSYFMLRTIRPFDYDGGDDVVVKSVAVDNPGPNHPITIDTTSNNMLHLLKENVFIPYVEALALAQGNPELVYDTYFKITGPNGMLQVVNDTILDNVNKEPQRQYQVEIPALEICRCESADSEYACKLFQVENDVVVVECRASYDPENEQFNQWVQIPVWNPVLNSAVREFVMRTIEEKFLDSQVFFQVFTVGSNDPINIYQEAFACKHPTKEGMSVVVDREQVLTPHAVHSHFAFHVDDWDDAGLQHQLLVRCERGSETTGKFSVFACDRNYDCSAFSSRVTRCHDGNKQYNVRVDTSGDPFIRLLLKEAIMSIERLYDFNKKMPGNYEYFMTITDRDIGEVLSFVGPEGAVFNADDDGTGEPLRSVNAFNYPHVVKL